MLTLANKVREIERTLYEQGHPFNRETLTRVLLYDNFGNVIQPDDQVIQTSKSFIQNISSKAEKLKVTQETAAINLRREQLGILLQLLRSREFESKIEAGNITYATIKPISGTPLEKYLKKTVAIPSQLTHWFPSQIPSFSEDQAKFEEEATSWLIKNVFTKSNLEIVTAIDIPILPEDVNATYGALKTIKPPVFESLDKTFRNRVITIFFMHGKDAIEHWRDFLGSGRDAKENTNPNQARALANPLFIDPTLDRNSIHTNNLLHGSRLEEKGDRYGEVKDDLARTVAKTEQMLAALS